MQDALDKIEADVKAAVGVIAVDLGMTDIKLIKWFLREVEAGAYEYEVPSNYDIEQSALRFR